MWEIVYTPHAIKDAKKISQSGLKLKVEGLLALLSENPHQTPPPYEKLVGNLKGIYSRRINLQHRLLYMVYDDLKTIKILRMWTHYE